MRALRLAGGRDEALLLGVPRIELEEVRELIDERVLERSRRPGQEGDTGDGRHLGGEARREVAALAVADQHDPAGIDLACAGSEIDGGVHGVEDLFLDRGHALRRVPGALHARSGSRRHRGSPGPRPDL